VDRASIAAGVLLVANSAAGTADDDAIEAAVAVLRGSADAAVDVEVARTGSPDELDAVLDRRMGRRLVVAGGDGSVHAVVAALHRRGELAATGRAAAPPAAGALGILPLGTGNDLARALGLPLDAAAAARVVLEGRDRPLDLLVDDEGGIVVNAVHLGVGAEAARSAERLKERLGKAAYAVGSLVAGAGSPGWRLRVEVDGRPVAQGDVPLLMVALGNGTSVGGGAELTPDASPDDGLVDVVVSAATGALARVGYALAMRDGDHVDRDDVLVTRGRVVSVSGEEFCANADGEVGGPLTRRTWTVLPAAWAVRVPA
jgi:YegS/Rv2252/BmrU family lipid kinase